jgi:hypothetical protein
VIPNNIEIVSNWVKLRVLGVGRQLKIIRTSLVCGYDTPRRALLSNPPPAKIQVTVEKGVLGINFRVHPSFPIADSLGGLEWFGTVTLSLGEGEASKCRAMCRTNRLFERLDDALMKEDGMRRIQDSIVGYFSLALELAKSNPERTLSPEENRQLSERHASANDLRIYLTEYLSCFSPDPCHAIGHDVSTIATTFCRERPLVTITSG